MSRIFAIGDIHGCIKPLRALLSKIDPEPGDTVVFLGDYIDRGPDSRAVVSEVRSYEREGVEVVAIKGNHEDMMTHVHTDRGLWQWWIENGGGATLESFGGTIPSEVLAWSRGLPTRFQRDGYFFAHAGVDPNVPLESQEDEALLWIRGKFLDSDKDFGAVVVHGHTPESLPELKGNRINVDTGCVYRGALTCVVLGGPDPVFISIPNTEPRRINLSS